MEKIKENIHVKLENEKEREERMMQQQQFIEQAKFSKSVDEVQFRKLLSVNIVASNVLKAKMQKTLDQYKHTEEIYNRLQREAKVNNPEALYDQYMEREQNYNNLVQRVQETIKCYEGVLQQVEVKQTRLKKLENLALK